MKTEEEIRKLLTDWVDKWKAQIPGENPYMIVEVLSKGLLTFDTDTLEKVCLGFEDLARVVREVGKVIDRRGKLKLVK